MVKVSSIYLTRTQSYSPSKSENWMCVEDPFLQIWSHILMIKWPTHYVHNYSALYITIYSYK